jgi:hypothetical protein
MSDKRFRDVLVFFLKVFLASCITSCAIKFGNYHLMWWYLILFARIRLGNGGEDECQNK